MQSILPDRYDVQARLGPLALTLSPLVLGVLVWTGLPSVPAAIVVTAVLAVFGKWLAELGRARGKKLEAALFRDWGGGRVTARLRCLDTSNTDKAALFARRQRVALLVPEVRFPTEQDEREDPAAADAIYDRAVGALFERQRQHNLVHAENCSYGFIRNALGLKPAAILFGFMGLLSTFHKSGWCLFSINSNMLTLTSMLIFAVMMWFVVAVTPVAVRRRNERLADALYKALQGMDLPVRPSGIHSGVG